jgi:broad specificity phosphatase PhoE
MLLRRASFAAASALNVGVRGLSTTHAEDKTFIFVRHGLTEMNERLRVMPWYSENFEDGALWDTRLSQAGVEQAKERHRQLLSDEDLQAQYYFNHIEVLLASPLTRALHTAEIVFSHEETLLPNIPKLAHPLLAERLYLSSEVGRCSSELKKEFTDWDFSAVPAGQPWWYVHGKSTQAVVFGEYAKRGQCGFMGNSSSASSAPIINADNDVGSDSNSNRNSGIEGSPGTEVTAGSGGDSYTATQASAETPTTITTADDPSSASAISSTELTVAEHPPYVEWRPEGRYCCEGEPKEVFTNRMATLREFLRQRPERYIAVVAHWGVLKALTGREFENCEVRVVRMSEFLPEPYVTDT